MPHRQRRLGEAEQERHQADPAEDRACPPCAGTRERRARRGCRRARPEQRQRPGWAPASSACPAPAGQAAHPQRQHGTRPGSRARRGRKRRQRRPALLRAVGSKPEVAVRRHESLDVVHVRVGGVDVREKRKKTAVSERGARGARRRSGSAARRCRTERRRATSDERAARGSPACRTEQADRRGAGRSRRASVAEESGGDAPPRGISRRSSGRGESTKQ